MDNEFVRMQVAMISMFKIPLIIAGVLGALFSTVLFLQSTDNTILQAFLTIFAYFFAFESLSAFTFAIIGYIYSGKINKSKK